MSVGKTLNPSEIASHLCNMVLTIPALQASVRRCALLNASYGGCSFSDSFIHLLIHFFIRCCERPLYAAQCQAQAQKAEQGSCGQASVSASACYSEVDLSGLPREGDPARSICEPIKEEKTFLGRTFHLFHLAVLDEVPT